MTARPLAVAALLAGLSPTLAAEPARPPNVVLILADDLGYGDLGCYGQQQIQTPRLDRLAAEGTRFTQCYAGSTVCAPSRCCLMTGLHTGHAVIRGNADVPLRPQDTTVAEVLRKAGYRTALVGKWGLGEAGTTGTPNQKGFDEFYGYLSQVHAHNYYPDFLWRNTEKEPIPGNVVKNGVASQRAHYAPDLLLTEALGFVERNRDRPFILEFATIVPHANNERGQAEGNGMEVPTDAPYTNRPWPPPQKNHAATITRLDADVGRLLDRLKELGLEENTLVLFTSDNGPHQEGGANPAFFQSAGPLRGLKRDLTEGGIREPMIARWPGHVPAGRVSEQVWAFWDFLPTAAELAGATALEGIDGLSMVPALLGRGEQRRHECLYWEFHERGFQQAVRFGDWKAIRPQAGQPPQLYDLRTDPGERTDVAGAHPEEVARAEAFFRQARTESPQWPIKPPPGRRPNP
jgi:arylsulfatase A-like enzyme